MADENIVLEGRSRRAVERLAKFGHEKIRLDPSVDQATRQIVRAYARAWQVTQREARSMSQYAAEQMHSGQGFSPRDIAKMDRVDRAQHALERQIRDLSKFTGVTVTGIASRRTEHDVDRVLNSLADITGLDRRFTKPSGAAMEGLILRSTGRIESATRRLSAQQSVALKDGLFRGLVLGENPRETAKHVYDQTEGAFFGGLHRATTIALTEISDANRYANRLAYADSEFVTGWKWLAQLDSRTCPACWAMHNTLHDPSEMQFGHQRCRCTMVPVLADDMPEDNDLGDPEALFWGLPREQQLAIMGPGRLKALEAGARFTDLTYLKPNAAWRPSQVVTNVADLAGIAELNIATTPGDVITIPGETNESILTHAYAQGGLTINALTGAVPTSGFVVARNGTSEVIDAREFFGPAGPPRVAAWLTKYGDRLDEPGAHMGMWYDTANGKVVLDVVEILKDRDAAIALGRTEDQIAIFDLDTFTEINTGGTGGYAQSLTSRLSEVDVGRTATIRRDGKTYTGTVTVAGEWGVRIKTADGQEINATADQVTFESGLNEAVKSRVQQVYEIQEAGRKQHGLSINLAGSDVASAKEISDALVALRHDWPDIKKPTWVATGHLDGAYGQTVTNFVNGIPSSSVTINQDNARGYKAWADHMHGNEQDGFFHRGTSQHPARYTVDHEWGHVTAMALLGDPRLPTGHEHLTEITSQVYNALFHDKIRENEKRLGVSPGGLDMTPDRIVNVWEGDPGFHAAIQRDLSGYSSKEPGELVAEAFAVYRQHGPGESVVADTVMRYLVRAYVKQFGHEPRVAGLDTLLGRDPGQMTLF